MTRAEELAAHRWIRNHAAASLFGRARAYARPQGPAPGAGVLTGVLMACVVWAAPVVVDAVRQGAPSSGEPGHPPAPALAGR
ncbi:hypothetical protein [Nocardioides daphniae]|uniref:Uncharacterized protein n=1 Tax=Nocardioides daphniae TaxID=402297 RepID=A0A4V1CWT6_9ACTN|nr:hypothetical protein [Nocardioides daphniae]QCC78397.1 hypothetical protein E2C04_16520 [Nocardioides daphniae]